LIGSVLFGKVSMAGRLTRFVRELHSYPRQFWVLVAGTFVYVAAAALAFPYEGIYLHVNLHVSMTWVGVVFGLVPAAVMPLQVWGGHLTDRFGRRRMIILASVSGIAWFVGFAFVRQVWQVGLLVAMESAFGWPLFQTASNAMIADVVPEPLRVEAYSISRVAMNVGVVLGPAVGGIALGLGATLREMFLAAAVGCALFTALALAWIRETRPASAVSAVRHRDAAGRSGYRLVLADRPFLVFCLIAALPVFCIGQFGTIYSIFIVSVLHVPKGDWGWLLAMNALIIATMQYPLIRRTRQRDPLLLLALSSALLAVGLGLSAFAFPLWPLVVLVMIVSLGEMFLSPVASAVVSDLAPEAVRGRYMGVWTVVWNGGASLGPAAGGLLFDRIGGRGNFLVLGGVGALGTVLLVALSRSWRQAELPGGAPAPRFGQGR
jgi:MFS family permease